MDYNVVAFTGQRGTHTQVQSKTAGAVISLSAWKNNAHALRTANGVFFRTLSPSGNIA